ncbi:TRAP transporter substrate-binding protein [Uliginosibacterium flavum]|uniref:TRAP transporter substrate-binding protein DctP n=1 Tax=Uliginosibacterium flavum TaxID=1396831 RepID=A0ABV2TPS4_9RHOO
MVRVTMVHGLVLLVALLGGGSVLARDLTLAEVHPPGHIMVQSEERLGTRLAEATKGALQLQLKHSGQLCNESQCWAKIKDGSLDIARVNMAELSKDLAAVKLMSLPYLFRSREHMWRVLGGEFGQRLEAEAAKNGAVVLTYYDSGTRSFYSSKKPIRSLADFAGLRVRVQNSPVYKDLIEKLGGTPVVLPYDKVIEAFKSGEIDAAENNTPSYVTSGHYKYAKYYSLDEHSSVPEVLVISKKAWTSLSPAQQQALKEAAVDSSEFMKKQWADSEVQSLAKAKKEGSVITEKSQIAMSGIEGYAVKLYSKYITDNADMETVLAILRTK